MNVDEAAVSTSAIRISLLGWVIVTVMVLLCVWMRTLAQAEDQLTGTTNSTDVIGKPVKTLEGKYLGRIKDLVINWRTDGYIEYAVLSFGGFLGLGVDYVTVPWDVLTLSETKDHFTLTVKEEDLKHTPGFAAYRFYDRSSAVLRSGRATVAQAAPLMKSASSSDVNGPVARSFRMQYAMEEVFNR
jgi:sporulation protein YlmC with PRC-barrel domain